MTQLEILAAIQQELVDLEQISFVAHRDTKEALDAIQSQGDEIALEWVRACKALFQHDRDAGKAFIRGSRAVMEASGDVLTWTRQALSFLQWRGSWKALDGFMDQLPAAYHILGAAGEARWAELGIAWCGRHLESGATYFRCPVAELAATHGIAGVEELVLPARGSVQPASSGACHLSSRRNPGAQSARRGSGTTLGQARRGHSAGGAAARR